MTISLSLQAGVDVYYTVCLAYSVLYEVLVKKKITLSLFRNVFLYDKIIRDGDYLLVFVYCMMLIMKCFRM